YYEQAMLAHRLLNEIPGVSSVRPRGALYCFPRLDPEVYPITDDQQFVIDLLRSKHLLVTHGTGFNWPEPDHFRLVTLPDTQTLEEAIGRIGEFLGELRSRPGRIRSCALPTSVGGPHPGVIPGRDGDQSHKRDVPGHRRSLRWQHATPITYIYRRPGAARADHHRLVRPSGERRRYIGTDPARRTRSTRLRGAHPHPVRRVELLPGWQRVPAGVRSHPGPVRSGTGGNPPLGRGIPRHRRLVPGRDPLPAGVHHLRVGAALGR